MYLHRVLCLVDLALHNPVLHEHVNVIHLEQHISLVVISGQYVDSIGVDHLNHVLKEVLGVQEDGRAESFRPFRIGVVYWVDDCVVSDELEVSSEELAENFVQRDVGRGNWRVPKDLSYVSRSRGQLLTIVNSDKLIEFDQAHLGIQAKIHKELFSLGRLSGVLPFVVEDYR
jgi:hypothetical protein